VKSVRLEKGVSEAALDIVDYMVKLGLQVNAALTGLLALKVMQEKRVLLAKEVIRDYKVSLVFKVKLE
jgi:hypothetical protein